MRSTALRCTPLLFVSLALVSPALVEAQPPAKLQGAVTDALGGVLPGVSVTVSTTDGVTLATTVTDEVGAYAIPSLPPTRVTIQFELDGFEPGRVDVTLEPGRETTVGERLTLAQFTEQVTVYAAAPPAPLPPLIVKARPITVPLPSDEMETVCLPAMTASRVDALATVHSHRSEAERTIYAKGDELNIEGGLDAGLTIGRNLVVRRSYRPHGTLRAELTGEHTAGIIQIVSASPHTSTGVVIHACNEVMQGDYLAAYVPEPVRQAHPRGEPDFDDGIAILFGDVGHLLGATRRLMVIDRGGAGGIDVGQRLTLFRRQPQAADRPYVIGEAVVVAAQTHSATIRVERATEAIWFGDLAAPQRPSPLAAPLKAGGSRQR